MKTNSILFVVLMLTLIFVTTGCELPTSEDMWGVGNEKGFLPGLWAGFIAPVKFIISFFMDDLHIYAVNNNGHWYDFGFLLGIGGFSGGIFKSARRRRR